MKILPLIALALFPFTSMASNPELLLYMFRADYSDYEMERSICIDNAYILETKAMDKTSDAGVRVRMSRFEYHPAGIMSCYVKFIASDRTGFLKKRETFPTKKCNDKNDEIAAMEGVVWTDYYNRVKLPDGSKGCLVDSVRGYSLGD
jgi:hypothetical protein